MPAYARLSRRSRRRGLAGLTNYQISFLAVYDMMDLFITLDYELFLGEKTGTPENCLIQPMNELCSIADRVGFKYIIFVDAAYLLRLFQLKGQCSQLSQDYALISNHIKQLANIGHDIQLHFHPQWLYSTYNNIKREWNLDYQHYKLSDMETGFAFEALSASKRLLDDLVGYKTYTFRAGGYCLDSFAEFTRLFKENGIKIDSSVARNMHENKYAHSFDYRRVPSPSIYRFSDNVTREFDTGDFVELSINSAKINIVEYLTVVRKLQKKYSPTLFYKDGESINNMEKDSLLKRVLSILKGKVYLASIDGVSSTMLPLYINKSKENTCILIGHPKNATDASIYNFNTFLERNKNTFHIKTTKDLLK